MLKYIFSILTVIYSFSSSVAAQSNLKLSNDEVECLTIFKNFKLFIQNTIQNNQTVEDSANIKYIIFNCVVSDIDLELLDETHFKETMLHETKFNQFKSNINQFYRYYSERRDRQMIQHLSAIPLRLSADKCMYEKLTPFQRANTFLYFDDREPAKPLGYMLFLPKYKKSITAPRIWSWTLQFELGHWAFKSVMGEVGMEYFLSEGVKGPKPENRIERW